MTEVFARWLLCATLILALTSPAQATETLSDAWTAALTSHQQLAAAEAEREAAHFGLASARAERMPRLDVSGGYTQLDSAPRFSFGDNFVSPRIFSGDNFSMANAQVSLPLYTSGAVSRGIDAARSQADAASGQVDAVRADVKLGAAVHYIAVLRNERALTVARANVAMLESHTADAENRFNIGDVARNDYLAASVQLADARQRELRAENQLELAQATYNRFLGRPQGTTVALDPLLNVTALLPSLNNLDQLLGIALEQRAEIDSIAARADALQAQAAAERARSRPQLMLISNYTRLETAVLADDEFWMVGLAVSWNPFDAGRNSNRVAAIRRQAQAVNHRLSDMSADIQLEVRSAWLDAQEAEQRIQVAEAAVIQAEENLRVARDRYKAGAGTNTEVLGAQALMEQALNNIDGANFDAALAKLRLARASGQL
ncbi:TolC family protein [Woeseia oceani]|uniref:Transporter n=1 Tax=Woeseia oceani TaxID=1548547 RepID=A0A193LDD0_9GAMM|nr:TolC family protein [Woeseia oceani]ANO50535.1 hypothetical protein BA177_04280 [Woeseia oceani]